MRRVCVCDCFVDLKVIAYVCHTGDDRACAGVADDERF